MAAPGNGGLIPWGRRWIRIGFAKEQCFQFGVKELWRDGKGRSLSEFVTILLNIDSLPKTFISVTITFIQEWRAFYFSKYSSYLCISIIIRAVETNLKKLGFQVFKKT